MYAIGTCRVDIKKNERRLDWWYPLHTPIGVSRTLEHLHRLRGARLHGDLDAATLLMDFWTAYNATTLSEREHQVLHYQYELQYTQRETSVALGISRDSVQQYSERAKNKIAKTARRQTGDAHV